MDERDSPNFCSQCGAPLRDSDTFCTSCGSTVKSSTSSYGSYEQRPVEKSNTLTWVAILCGIWAAIAVIEGATTIIYMDWMIDILKDSPDVWEELMEIITEETVRNVFYAVGALFLASGIFSVLAAVLCAIRKHYTIALVSCVVASVLVLIGLVGIIGIIVSYFIYKNKGDFAEQQRSY